MTEPTMPRPAAPRILVVGESLVDLIPIDDHQLQAHPGGSPANVAVGLGRFGIPVRLATCLGQDHFGDMLKQHFATNGVELDYAPGAAPTTISLVSPGESAGYTFYTGGSALVDWPSSDTLTAIDPDAVCLHTGSLAALLGPGSELIAQRLSAERMRDVVTLTFDPNVRPDELGEGLGALREKVERRVRLCHVVKASSEDIERLYPSMGPREVARRWHAMGPTLVVITLGSRGAVVRTGLLELHVPAVDPGASIVDTVGAGDAFMAGLLAELYTGRLLGSARHDDVTSMAADQLAGLLLRACAAGAVACTRSGPRMPSPEEVDTAMRSTRERNSYVQLSDRRS